MKIIAENFGSLEYAELDLSSNGLTLIEGPTGSGKSTLCDLAPWCLFGLTSKGGAVSEVLTWPGDTVTKVTLTQGNVTIHRARGKAKDNDLYWDISTGPQRGKDLPDTQKRINELLGYTYETYTAGAYYHEFSQTAQFFTTTAKNRRQITEQLVDLSLAVTTQTKAKEARARLIQEMPVNDLIRLETYEEALDKSLSALLKRAHDWEIGNETREVDLKARFDKFEATRESDLNEARRAIQTHKTLIQTLPDTNLYPKCSECGHDLDSPEVHALRHQQAVNEKSTQRIEIISEKIKEIKLRQNPHTQLVEEENPFLGEIERINHEVEATEVAIADMRVIIHEMRQSVEDLELLQGVLNDYRSTTIRNSIELLQSSTNDLLSRHFDAELRVEFEVLDADKLEVLITKDGNACSFTQLSKGQRCILKLCFGTAVMSAVSNNSGVDFQHIFYDEALDGLDDINKTKAFGLLQEVASIKSSVFVVEHSSAIKVLFDSTYSVTLVDGKTQIAKT